MSYLPCAAAMDVDLNGSDLPTWPRGKMEITDSNVKFEINGSSQSLQPQAFSLARNAIDTLDSVLDVPCGLGDALTALKADLIKAVPRIPAGKLTEIIDGVLAAEKKCRKTPNKAAVVSALYGLGEVALATLFPTFDDLFCFLSDYLDSTGGMVGTTVYGPPKCVSVDGASPAVQLLCRYIFYVRMRCQWRKHEQYDIDPDHASLIDVRWLDVSRSIGSALEKETPSLALPLSPDGLVFNTQLHLVVLTAYMAGLLVQCTDEDKLHQLAKESVPKNGGPVLKRHQIVRDVEHLYSNAIESALVDGNANCLYIPQLAWLMY